MDRANALGRHRLRRERLTDLVVLALALQAALLAYLSVHGVVDAVPQDFGSYRAGAESLRLGMSVYSDPAFVYPPTAAVLFLPFTYLKPLVAGRVWLYVEVAALILALLLATRPTRPVARIVAVVFVILVLKSDLFLSGFYVGNVSVLLAPVAVGALLCFEKGRWRLGCALIVASLLLKPLLAPLLLLPLLRGRWRDLLATGLPALAVVVIAVYALPGGGQFWSVIPRLIGGSNLVHHYSFLNLSLNGLGSRLHMTAAFLPLRLLVVLGGLAAMVGWARGSGGAGSTAAMGAVVLLTTLLAGSLSESHYLLLLAPVLLLALSYSRPLVAVIGVVAAFATLFIPRALVGHFLGSWDALQVRFVIAEALMFISALVFILYPRRLNAVSIWLPRLGRASVSPAARTSSPADVVTGRR